MKAAGWLNTSKTVFEAERASFAIVHAWGDAEGNLVHRMKARNFNPIMATAGKVTIPEVEQLGKTGSPLLCNRSYASPD
jgi:acyl CoA:acetate/3-ketoacid CoA transferase alpha subunit